MPKSPRAFIRHFAFTLAGVMVAAASAWAAEGEPPSGEKKAPVPKPVRDADFAEFNQLRRMPATKDEAAMKKVVASGLAFLRRHPASLRATEVVNGLAFYANGIDGKRPAARALYVSHLKSELAVVMREEERDEEMRTPWLALAAALADYEVRAAYNADNLATFRRQIDVLAGAPAASRFLVERERSYVHVLSVGASLSEAGAHLRTLLAHRDPALVAMARTEMNLVELKQAPLELKLTALDGRPVDLVRLRGRVVVLFVWSTGQKGAAASLEAVRKLHDEYRRRGLEVVSICVDPADQRAKVAAAVQQNSVPWPVHHDGLGLKHPLLDKLNLTSAPALLLLDQKGFLQHAMQGTHLSVNLPYNQLVAHTRRLLVIR